MTTKILARFMVAVLMALTLFSIDLSAQPGGYHGPGGMSIRGGAGPHGGFSGGAGFIRGSVVLSPEEKGGEETPGTGVTIMVVTYPEDKSAKSDTLYAVAGETGNFFIQRPIPVGKAYVKFSFVGYEEIAKTIPINRGENKIVANLKPDTEQLAAAVVKEVVEPLSIKGDTLVFHASAVKTNKGEMAIDILEQMPGVEVSENSVSVLNEAVKNVYIDGALLFGEAPMKALNNLAAEEVISIKSYQEYDNKDPRHKISKTENKQRVLDIETKSKPKMVVSGDFLAGGGYDTDTTFHKFRYTSGGEARIFSEKIQSVVSFNVNNINDASSRMRSNSFRSVYGGDRAADLRALSLSANFNYNWMSAETRNFRLGRIGARYSYSDNYTVNESLSEQIYFPTEKYESRESHSSSYTTSTAKVHDFSINGYKSLPDGFLNASASYSMNDALNTSRSSNYNFQDDLPKQGTSNRTRRVTDADSYSANISFNKGFNNKFRISTSLGADKSSSLGTTAKVDTTTSTITYKVIDMNSDNGNRSWNARQSFRYEIADNQALSLSYSYQSSFRQSLQYAYDVTDPGNMLPDSVNTHIYTYDNNTHTAGLTYNYYIEKIKGNISADLGFNSRGFNRSEEFPEEYDYDRRFFSFSPRLSFNTESMINRWNFSVSSDTSTPSVEQLRPRLDNSNLYSVSVGNPDLKQARQSDFRLSYSTCLGKEVREAIRANEAGDYRETTGNVSTISFSIGGSVNSDVIVNRRTYYAAETYIPKYNYTMPAQSTLSTYENVDNSYSANASVSFDTPLNFIMWNLNSGISMNWDDAPSYVNDVLTRTENFRPNVRLGLRSNFSRNVRININTNAAYVYSHNTEKNDTKYFTERISLGWDLNNIFQLFYLGGNYTKSFMQGIQYANVNDNILNLNAGLRFGPRNNFDFSVAVHDLFNKTSGFSTSMNSDFIRNSWTHNFGRYVMFTFAYRFNTMPGVARTGGPGGSGGGFGGPGFGRGGFGGGSHGGYGDGYGGRR